MTKNIELDVKMNKKFSMFAHKRVEDGKIKFLNIFPSKIQTYMCGEKKEIVSVSVQEDENGEYFGWKTIKDGEEVISLIWPSFICLDICFPYGVKQAIEAGRGVAVKLSIEEINMIPKEIPCL